MVWIKTEDSVTSRFVLRIVDSSTMLQKNKNPENIKNAYL